MLKKLLLLLLVATTACSHKETSNKKICPQVTIQRSDAYFTQKGWEHEEFSVELIGYEGYCYLDNRINKHKAVISPIYRINRLRPNDETDVMFHFFAEPPNGRKKIFYQDNIKLTTDLKEAEPKGREIELEIPENMKYNYNIKLGMYISNKNKKFNNKTFDVPLNYEEN